MADGRIRFRRGPAPLPGAESHILADGRREELVVGVLEQEADLAADAEQVGLDDRQAVDEHGGLIGRRLRQDAVQMKQKRRFSGAVRADQSDGLALRDAEGDIFEGGPAVGISKAQVFHVHDVHGHFQPRAIMAR